MRYALIRKNGILFTFKIKRNWNGLDVKDGSGSTANNDDPYVCWVYDNCTTGRGDSAGNLSRLFTLAPAPSLAVVVAQNG